MFVPEVVVPGVEGLQPLQVVLSQLLKLATSFIGFGRNIVLYNMSTVMVKHGG